MQEMESEWGITALHIKFKSENLKQIKERTERKKKETI
jgi:hypothetical protein